MKTTNYANQSSVPPLSNQIHSDIPSNLGKNQPFHSFFFVKPGGNIITYLHFTVLSFINYNTDCGKRYKTFFSQ